MRSPRVVRETVYRNHVHINYITYLHNIIIYERAIISVDSRPYVFRIDRLTNIFKFMDDSSVKT